MRYTELGTDAHEVVDADARVVVRLGLEGAGDDGFGMLPAQPHLPGHAFECISGFRLAVWQMPRPPSTMGPLALSRGPMQAHSRERTSFERVAMENLVDLGLFLAGLGVFFLGVAALWWVGDWSGKQ